VRLYLDANVIIYCIEGLREFQEAALRWVERAAQAEQGLVFTSRFARLECLSKPVAEGNSAKQALFEGFFGKLGLISVSDDLLELAVSLRARFTLRSADAVHLATAIAYKADVFLSGDRELARCTEIKVVPIP
jgi:predicted nucleic acid-binding protein